MPLAVVKELLLFGHNKKIKEPVAFSHKYNKKVPQ
jgi:hypothetical protein